MAPPVRVQDVLHSSTARGANIYLVISHHPYIFTAPLWCKEWSPLLFGGIFDTHTHTSSIHCNERPALEKTGEENGSPDPWTIWLRTNPRFKLEPQGRLPSCSGTKRMELGARVEPAFLNLKGDF